MVIESKVKDAVKLGKIKEDSSESWVEIGMTNLALMESSFEGLSANIQKPVEMQAPKTDEEDKQDKNYNFDYLTKNDPAKLQMDS